MTVKGQLLGMLERVAEALGSDLRERLVFVGGCTTALYITDEVTLEQVRATDDVDLIVNLSGYPKWAKLQDELRRKGFVESPEDGIVCRMRLDGLKVDFMPDDPGILGFSNQWYARGIETSVRFSLTRELEIRHLTPVMFVASKLEAYRGRGHGDLLGSRDLEDVLLVIDGRAEIVDEIRRAEPSVKDFIACELSSLLASPDFSHFLEGNVRSPEGRAAIVRHRIEQIARS